MPDRNLVVLTAVTGLVGFSIVTSFFTGVDERERSAPRRAQLVRLIDDRQELVNDLDEAVETLRRDVGRARDRASRDDSNDRAADQIVDALSRDAGTVSLRGRGLVVSLSASTREPPSPEEAGAYEIHDTDLQLIVNALWGSGAEAVAINESRLVATTPIRSAGSTIVVNFRPLAPPYRVVAIGARRDRFEGSEIAERFRRWSSLFGLGYTIKEAEDLTVPAYTGRVSISAASPIRQGR